MKDIPEEKKRKDTVLMECRETPKPTRLFDDRFGTSFICPSIEKTDEELSLLETGEKLACVMVVIVNIYRAVKIKTIKLNGRLQD